MQGLIEFLKSMGYEHTEGHKNKSDMSIVYKKATSLDIKIPHYLFITVSLEDKNINVYREPVAGGTLYNYDYNINIDISEIEQNFDEFKLLLSNIIEFY